MAAAVAERWASVQKRIIDAAEAAGRDPGEVRVVAVTKGFGVEVVRAAHRAGLRRFGENRLQEAEAKVAAVPGGEWHLVGHLQSNKARRAVLAFDWIHAIDSIDLLERVGLLAAQEGREPRLLLQANLTGSASQHGFPPAELEAGGAARRLLATRLFEPPAMALVGLMGIGPLPGDSHASRAAFAQLRALRDGLEQESGRALPELSMGMSADLELAVAEGATLVRLGTALFGERPKEA